VPESQEDRQSGILRPTRYRLIVFDWDGTLMDSAAMIVSCVQAASRDIGLPVPSDGRARHIIGLGLGDAMAYLFPQLDPAQYREVADRYRHHFFVRGGETPLFEGTPELLEELFDAGFLLAVATGKGRRGLDRELNSTGLKRFFHATRCADESFSKPHPAMLLEIIEELGVSAERTLMVGDTTHDLEMAQSAGVSRLAVGYGAHPRDHLIGRMPLACVDDVASLRTWIAVHG